MFGKKELKEFYSNNKDIINIIANNTSIYDFFSLLTDKKENKIIHFYKLYLEKNKDQIEQILDLLEKMKELEISEVILDDELDFTKEVKQITASFPYNDRFEYLDNMEIIPNYDSNIKYITTGSDYKLSLRTGIKDFS